jgi:hypothetical protein
MQPSDIALVESALGVQLPVPYREALADHGLQGETDDHLEFVTDARMLIEDNKHFKGDPEDLSEYRKPGVLGAVRFFLSFGSGKRLRKNLHEWHQIWKHGQRFLIGSDGGEESFFIVLTEANPKVYCFEYESHRAYPVAESVREWVLVAKQRQSEGSDA